MSPRPLLRWLWQLTKDVVTEYRRDGVGDVAASITFWTILSIPAAALALVSALSSLESAVGTSLANDVETEVQDYLRSTFADSEAVNSTVGALFDSTNASVVTVAALVAFFTLSRAFAGLIRALDVAYEVEDGRPWWRVRLVALGLGLGSVVIVASAAVVLALLPSLPLGPVARFVAAPATVVVLVLWAATIFHIGPNHSTPWRYDLPGAIVTAVGWVAASQGFALYVRVADRGNQVQTGVGAILLALTLLYALSIVLIVGAEVNDVISRRAGVVQQPVSIRQRAVALRDVFGARLRRHRRRPATVDESVPSDPDD